MAQLTLRPFINSFANAILPASDTRFVEPFFKTSTNDFL